LIEILEITSDPQFSWTVFHSNSMNQQQQHQKKLKRVSIDSTVKIMTPSSSSTSINSSTSHKKLEFILFPHTKVIAIAPEYSLTFLINFSSSMSTIDTSINRSIISEAIKIYIFFFFFK